VNIGDRSGTKDKRKNKGEKVKREKGERRRKSP
jgi:hypothetical protein